MAKKLYYKIGEACKRLDIQPYVLRYWETEFSVLAPSKSSSGQRTYSDRDLRVIQRIKELLYEEGYTIAGAKKKLEKEDLAKLSEVGEPKAAPEPKTEAEPEADSAPKAKPKPKPKPAAPKKTKATPKAKAKPRKATGSASAAEARLRRGIREALKESRAILEILDSD